MAGLSISQAWEETKARIAADGKLMVAVAAALVLLPQTIVALVGPPELLSGETPPGWFRLLVFAAAFAGLAAQIAIARLAIGPATSVGEAIAHGAKRFLPAFAALLLLALLLFVVAVPLLLLISGPAALEAAAGSGSSAPPGLGVAILLILLLGVLLGAQFLMVLPVAAAEPGGPIHILKRSWQLALGHYLRLVAFVVLLIIVVLIVSIAIQLGGGALIQLLFDIKPFSVGALLYGLLFGAVQAGYALAFSVLLARIYVQLSGVGSVSVPRSGT